MARSSLSDDRLRRTHFRLEQLGTQEASDFLYEDSLDGPYAVVAPRQNDLDEAHTILAMSGGTQTMVSSFFLKILADARNWQVVIPLARRGGFPLENFYEDANPGQDRVDKLVTKLLDGELSSACGVRGNQLHLVGNSNGSLSVLRLASRLKEKGVQVASVTCLAGINMPTEVDLAPLYGICVQLFVGEQDTEGHCQSMQDLKVLLDNAEPEIYAKLRVDREAGHENLWQYVTLDEFWENLLVADNGETSGEQAGAATEPTVAMEQDAAPAPAADPDAEEAAPAPDPAPVCATSLRTYSYDTLKVECPAGVEPTAKEQALSDADFNDVFKMSKADFAGMPAWKQNDAKKKAGLF